MSRLILLGAGAFPASEVIPANPGEPYRVGWNISNQITDIAAYLRPAGSPYASSFDSAFVLTDHGPLDFVPTIKADLAIPVDRTTLGQPAIFTTAPVAHNPPMRIDRITDIAYPDRTGVLPKIFMARFGATADIKDVWLYRYNLNASCSLYFGMRIRKETDGNYWITLSYDFGQGLIESGTGPVGTNFTDVIRMVVYPDKLEGRFGEPGSFIMNLPFSSMPAPTAGAHLTLMESRLYPVEVAGSTGLDGLYIYDGTF